MLVTDTCWRWWLTCYLLPLMLVADACCWCLLLVADACWWWRVLLMLVGGDTSLVICSQKWYEFTASTRPTQTAPPKDDSPQKPRTNERAQRVKNSRYKGVGWNGASRIDYHAPGRCITITSGHVSCLPLNLCRESEILHRQLKAASKFSRDKMTKMTKWHLIMSVSIWYNASTHVHIYFIYFTNILS